MLGTLLKDRYRVEAKLGEGGMGVVYRAQDTLLNRPVAIKSLTPALAGGEGVRRLLREAQAAAQLTHPNIVAVYDVIEEGDARLIVMEYVQGRPLSELVPLEIPRAVDLAVQVCRALEYAHSRRVIHRDIKPENIMVTDGSVAKVMDFGLARSEGRSRLTQSGLIVGTVAYMAPEQVLGGTVDARSDLYSLGCVLYEVLTGRRLFEGDDPFTVLSQHVNVMPVAPRWHNAAIPPTLDAIVMHLLAKDPDERYPTAAAVIEALGLVAVESETAAVVQAEAPATRTTLLERIVRGRLVGRAAELQELREHLDRMLSGEGRLVLISGEPGIGKTRLAEELAVYGHLRGASVLRGHCYEQEVAVPYLPFMETLGQLYQNTGQAILQLLGDRADDLGRLLPELGYKRGETSALTPEDERIRVFDAVSQWVAAAARQRPLVFVLDDLHWGDRASLRLLHHLARHTRGERILMLGTYREMELDLQHPFNNVLSEMNRERLFYRQPLRRLSLEDTRTLLSGLFDVEVSGELAGAVYQETEGNPFFIEEVVKSLVEEGRIYREGGRWQRLTIQELEIPQSVRAVIGKRVQKAGEACRRVLAIAAVIGREFDPELLVRISQFEEEQVLDALDEAVRLQLIREVRLGRAVGYAFEHALIRQTLYESLNPRRRARLHQQVGEALEDLYRARLDDHLEEVAYHFGEAGLATAEKGIEYNLRAAQKAASLFALEAAERRLTVARELAEAAEDPSAQVRMAEALGDLYLNFAERRRAMEAYQQALDLLKTQGDERSDQAVGLYCKFAEAGAGFATDPEPAAAGYARRAVELLRERPDQPLKARALSLLALHQVRGGELAAARATAQEAVDLATRLDDRQELVKAYQAMASVHRSSNEWDRFREVVEQRRRLAGSAFTSTDVDLYWDLVQGAIHAGNLQEAERIGREFLELAEKLRSPTALFSACDRLSGVLLYAGKWDEALRLGERAIELGRRIGGVELITGWSLARTAWIFAGRGEEERVRERLARIDTLGYEVPPEHQSPRLIALEIAHRIGDREPLTRLLTRAEAERPRCLTCTLVFYMTTGKARLWLGDVTGAQDQLNAAQGIRPDLSDPFSVAALSALQALIEEADGDLDNAVKHVEEAVHALGERPLALEHFFLREDAARIYLKRGRPGDAERARELLAPALRLYETVGARRFEAEARKLLDSPTGQ